MPSPSSNDSSTSTRPSNPKPNHLPTLNDRLQDLRSQIRHANSATTATTIWPGTSRSQIRHANSVTSSPPTPYHAVNRFALLLQNSQQFGKTPFATLKPIHR